MDVHELALARRLVERLELRELPELVGQRFDARTLDELLTSADLLPLVEIEGRFDTPAANLEGTLVKYGLVDLKYPLSRWPADLQRTGATVVRSLIGDSSAKDEIEDEQLEMDRLGCLEEIVADIEAGVRELRVLARAQSYPELTMRQRVEMTFHPRKRTFPLFPVELEIFDAYITNAPMVGLNRYFFM